MMDFSEANSMFLEHYQLAHDPFAERVPNFQFQSAKRKQVMEQLVHFARYGNFLLLLTGPHGSGKTMLRQALVASSTKETLVHIVVSGQHTQDAAAVMHSLAVGLKAENASLDGLLRAIEQLTSTGSEVHVLVDDAQALDEEAIKLLQHLTKGRNDVRAAVYLFGTPALQTLVQDVEQGNPDVSHHLVTLEPWNQAEIESYLRTRLGAAGANLDIFTEQELEVIIRDSGGWPGVVNQLAKDQLMARMFDRPKRRALPPLPYKYLALLLVIAFLIVGIWYWQDSKPATKYVVQLPDVSDRPMVSSQRVSELAERQVPREIAPAPKAELAPVLEVANEILTEPEFNLERVVPEPIEKAESVTPAPVVEAKPVVTKQPKPTVEKPAQVAQVQQNNKPASKQSVVAKPKPRSWYHAQPPQNFTLQLMATSNVSAVRKYADRDPQFHFFRKLHNGKYLYVLTYGSFASREQATAVEPRLPAELRSNKPWVRNFSSVVQEIR